MTLLLGLDTLVREASASTIFPAAQQQNIHKYFNAPGKHGKIINSVSCVGVCGEIGSLCACCPLLKDSAKTFKSAVTGRSFRVSNKRGEGACKLSCQLV